MKVLFVFYKCSCLMSCFPCREIVVQFNADVADGMQWKFVPTQREVLPFTIHIHTYIHKYAHAHLCTLTQTSLFTKILAHLKMHKF